MRVSTAAVHGADITGPAVAARFACFPVRAHMAHVVLRGTQGGKLRALEAQHPLLSGWNPILQEYNAAAQLLANAKGRHLLTIHCQLKKSML